MKGLGKKTLDENCQQSHLNDFLSGEEIKLLDENKSVIHFSAGETIIKQGTYVAQILFVQTGLVKLILESKNDKNVILKFVEGSSFVGLSIMGEPNLYPFSVISVTESTICFIRKEIILRLMKDNIQLNQYLLKWSSNDHLFLYSKIATISTRNSHGKLASAMLYVTDGNFNINLLNLLTRKELAELASISIESTNKILLQMKHDKIIDINKYGISILRRDLIEKLSTVG